MFEIVFLGTSASTPSLRRNLTSQLVLHRDQRFLIDCGEGTQRQLLKSGLGFRRLNKVLLTHGHLDHILGLGGVVSTFARWEAIDTIRIYGGNWALERVRDLMDVVLRGGEIHLQVEFIELSPGIVMEGEDFYVVAVPVIHRGPGCFGFVFQEKSRRPFLPDKAEKLGVPEGPERRHLVEGQSVTLKDGRMIHPDQVLGQEEPGTKLVHVGDAAETSNLVQPAQRADALVIEATYLSEDHDLAERFGHLTAAQAARLARDASVKQLFLTHISRRYPAAKILAEAKDIFPNTVVPSDLDRFRIKR